MTWRICCHERSGAVSSTSQISSPGTILKDSGQLVISDQTVSRLA